MTKIHFLTAWTGRPRTSTTVVKFFEISAQDHGGQKLLFIPTLTGGAKSYDICDFNKVFFISDNYLCDNGGNNLSWLKNFR